MLWWLHLFFIVAALFKIFKPFLKGKFGEFAVGIHAKKYLTKERCEETSSLLYEMTNDRVYDATKTTHLM